MAVHEPVSLYRENSTASGELRSCAPVPLALQPVAWLLVANAVLFIAESFTLARSTPRGDEGDIALIARHVADRGTPILRDGDTTLILPQEYLGGVFRFLFHPPLYVYLFAIPKALGFDTDAAMRLVISTGTIATLGLLWLILTRLAGTHSPKSRRALGLALAVLLLPSSYFLHNVWALDIDNFLLTPILVWAVWALSRLSESPGWAWAAVAASAYALGLCSKLSTPFVVMGLAPAWFAITGRTRAALWASGAAVAAFLVFLALWGGYAAWLGVSFGAVFEQPLTRGLSARPTEIGLLRVLYFYVCWLSPPFLLLCVAVWLRSRRFNLRAFGANPFALWWLMGAAILLLYMFVRPAPGKYIAPGFAMLVIPLAVAVAGWGLVQLTRREAIASWVVVLALLLLFVALCPNLLLVPSYAPDAPPRPSTAWEFATSPRVLGLGVIVAGTLLACGALVRWSGAGAGRPVVLGRALVLAYLTCGLFLHSKVLADTRVYDFAPFQPRQESGIGEVAQYLREKVDPAEALLCPHEVGQLLGPPYRYLQAVSGWYEHDDETLLKLVERYNVRWLVTSHDFSYLTPASLAALEKVFVYDRAVGSFRVYHRSPRIRVNHAN
jgi:hypothetical protein